MFGYLEGYYIDCGNIYNGYRSFMKITGGGVNDMQGQYVFFVNKPDKTWAVHHMNGVSKNYHGWITSNETAKSQTPEFKTLTWRWWHSKEGNFHQGLSLRVESWNL